MRNVMVSLAIVASLGMTGCATTQYPQQNGQYQQQQQQVYGVVTQVNIVPMNVSKASGLGLVSGGLVGGFLGNRVGKGNGRKLATVAGLVGGAVVGNQIETNKNTQTIRGAQMLVHVDSGQTIQVTQADQGFYAGMRVRMALQNGQWQIVQTQ